MYCTISLTTIGVVFTFLYCAYIIGNIASDNQENPAICHVILSFKECSTVSLAYSIMQGKCEVFRLGHCHLNQKTTSFCKVGACALHASLQCSHSLCRDQSQGITSQEINCQGDSDTSG